VTAPTDTAPVKPTDTAPVKIVRVIARLNVGGPALHVTYLTEGLASRGYETTLVAGDVARGEESMERVANSAGVEIVRLPGLSRELSPVHDLVAALRLARILREVRPDIVHTHTAKAGAVGRFAALVAGRPRPVVVHTFHGHVLRGYFGAAGSRMFRAIERILALASDRLVAVSPEVRDELVGLGVAPASKFEVIRLGIDLEPRVRFDGDPLEVRRRLGIPTEAFLVGWFGRMTAVKRTDDLVRVLVALRRHGVDAALLLVGDGDDRPRLEQLAHELGVARSCLFLGYQEDVAPFYAISDAVVLTSANEGTPVTIIEALAAGRPVVVTAVGGVADVVEDGVTGYLVGAGDADAMADRLARLAADPSLAAALGAEGRRRVTERYAVSRLVDDVDRLYRSLLSRPSPGRVGG
jgi:glycosyltransferase involved in cell wall biosynthesis